MKIAMIEVHACSNCPFAVQWQDMGASGYYCERIGFEKGRFSSEFYKVTSTTPNHFVRQMGFLVGCPLPEDH